MLRGESEKIGDDFQRPRRLRPGRHSSTVLLSIDRNEPRVVGRVDRTAKCGGFIPRQKAQLKRPTRHGVVSSHEREPPAKSDVGKGAHGYSWPPFEPGNRVAVRSAFYVSALAASELEEVQTIADAVRALSPLDGEAQEPLVQLVAAQLWRQRQAVAYIDEVGIEKVARSSSLLRDLATLERPCSRV